MRGDQHVWTLRPRQRATLEHLLDGDYAPLAGFLGRGDYDRVLTTMHLADGTPWAQPVTLDVDEAFASTLDAGARVRLCTADGTTLAQIHVDDIYYPDHLREVQLRYGRMDRHHPAVVELLRHTGAVYLGGRVRDLRAAAGSAPPPVARHMDDRLPYRLPHTQAWQAQSPLLH